MNRVYRSKEIVSIVKTILSLVDRRRKLQLSILLFLMFLSGFAEVLSLGAVVPFIGILLNPSHLQNNEIAAYLFETLEISGNTDAIVFVTACFLTVVIAASLLRGTILLFNVRLSHSMGASFVSDLFRKSLFKIYEAHIAENSSNVISRIIRAEALTTIILSSLTILNGISAATLILAAIVWIDPLISMSTFVLIAIFYLAIIKFTSGRLHRNGGRILGYTNAKMKLMQEGLGGIRNVILEGRQQQYSNYFFDIVWPIKRLAGTNLVIGQAPRIVIEPIAIIVISSIGCWLALKGNLDDKLPIMAAFAFAAQRLLPTMQMVYNSWASINHAVTQIGDVLETLSEPIDQHLLGDRSRQLSFCESLTFENVSFGYAAANVQTFSNFHLEIKCGQRVGIFGPTGSGKSTLLDLMLGLLRPTAGQISVDGVVLADTDNIARWQHMIAHVPQDIHFTDSTILENIAFGVARDEIDLQRVDDAVRNSQLAELVERLPDGLNTMIGEGGKQLSGGQRQRIGIARALYLKANVLILDEATSALDSRTEQEVLNAISGLSNEMTVVIVTHRLETLSGCDIVHELRHGEIVRSVRPEVILNDAGYLRSDS